MSNVPVTKRSANELIIPTTFQEALSGEFRPSPDWLRYPPTSLARLVISCFADGSDSIEDDIYRTSYWPVGATNIEISHTASNGQHLLDGVSLHNSNHLPLHVRLTTPTVGTEQQATISYERNNPEQYSYIAQASEPSPVVLPLTLGEELDITRNIITDQVQIFFDRLNQNEYPTRLQSLK